MDSVTLFIFGGIFFAIIIVIFNTLRNIDSNNNKKLPEERSKYMDLFCSKCGNRLNVDANFCNNCGAKINTEFQNNSNQNLTNSYNGNSYLQNSYDSYEQSINNNYQQQKERITFSVALKNYFSCSFSGRSSRWGFFFTVLAVILPISIFYTILLAIFANEGRNHGMMNGGFIVLALINVLPTYALSARRFHDIGFSGWLNLIFFIPTISYQLIPTNVKVDRFYGYSYTTTTLNYDSPIYYVFSISTFLIAIFSLYVIFAPGTPGPNKYGLPSKY